jgi:hypothetical protein
MLDAVQPADELEIVPPLKLSAVVAGLFAARGQDFVSEAVSELPLGFDGIEHDFHAGSTRRSGGREPWYERGTEMRNERQVSIVAADELAVAAERMGIAEIRPEWIGANLVVEGVPRLSMLPPGTLMFFANGATLKVDGQNGPCKLSGRSIAEHVGMDDVAAGALLFPRHARRLRGLVAWVEKPGTVSIGETVSVRVPEQWIYKG